MVTRQHVSPAAVKRLRQTLLYTLVVPLLVTVVVPLILHAVDQDPPPWSLGWWRWLGLVPLAFGAACYGWCATSFAITGRGTPSPLDPPRSLLGHGCYRWTRNPIYVAIVAVLVGELMLFPAWLMLHYLAGSLVCMHLLVVLFEEPDLRRRFGPEYEQYCRQVPRWLGFRGLRATAIEPARYASE